MPTTWNPADKDADVVLSNGNLTASILHPNSGSVRSTASQTTGKWYLEYTANWGTSNANAVCGIMQAGANLLGGVGSDSLGWGFGIGGASNWITINNGGPNNIGGSGADGDVMGFCLDLNINKFFLKQNGVNFYGVPETGFGGSTIAAAAWFAACGCTPAFDETAIYTVNFGLTVSAFGPPSGFSWWDTVSAYSVNTLSNSIIRKTKVVGI